MNKLNLSTPSKSITTQKIRSAACPAMMCALLLGLAGLMSAAPKYYDTGTTGGLNPGNATWDTGTTAVWGDSTTGTDPGTWADNDDAIFYTTTGASTLTIGAGTIINANMLWQHASGQGTTTIDGGAIRFNNSGTAIISAKNTFTINSNIILNADDLVFFASAPLVFNGSIGEEGGSRNFTKLGAAALTFGGVSTFTGTALIYQGNVVFTGAAAMPNADFVFGKAGWGTADTSLTIAPTTSGTYRRTNSFTFDGIRTPYGNGFNINGLVINAANDGHSVEQFGDLNTRSGMLRMSVDTPADYNLRVEFGSFNRSNGTMVLLNRGGGGRTYPGTETIVSRTGSSSNIVFSSTPVMSGTGAFGTTSAPVVVGMFSYNPGPGSETAPDPATLMWGFVTYDPDYGVRSLRYDEYVSYYNNATLAHDSTLTEGSNLLLRGTYTYQLNEELTVNSLSFGNATPTITGTGKLNVTSGMMYFNVNTNIRNGELAFGDAEGILLAENQRIVSISATISGSKGLTLGLTALGTNVTRIWLQAANTFTGTTRVLGSTTGLTVGISHDLALQYSTLDYNNYGAKIQFGESGVSNVLNPVFGGLSGAQALDMLNKGSAGGGVSLTVGGNNESTVYGGVMSGASASLIKVGAGVLRLEGVNTYTGSTKIQEGMIELGRPDALKSNVTAITNSSTIGLGYSGNYNLTTSGTGAIVVRDGWEIVMTGANPTTLGMLGAETGGTITVGSEAQIRNARLSGNGTFIFDTGTAADWSVANKLEGGGLFIKTGEKDLTLSGASTHSGTTKVGAGTLRLAHAQASGASTVWNDHMLVLDFAGVYASANSGTGLNTVSEAADATLAGDNTGFTGRWDIQGKASAGTQANIGSGIYDISGTAAMMTINPASGGFTFGNRLLGAGTLRAVMAAGTDEFKLAATSGADFAGTVRVGRGSFVVGGNGGQNNTVLSNATLAADVGSTITIATGTNAIGGFTMDGGRLIVDIANAGDTQATGIAATGMLNLNSGTVKIDPAKLLDGVSVLLVKAERATGASNLGDSELFKLVDQSDAIIAGVHSLVLHDSGGNIIGSGTKKYSLNTGAANDGLYLTYGMFDMVLDNGKTLVVGGPSSSLELAGINTVLASITGGGNIHIDAGATLIALSGANTVTGTTTLASGSLRLNALNTFSPHSPLVLNNNTMLDVYGSAQTIKSLASAADSLIQLGGGSVTMQESSVANGRIAGAGALTINSGTLTVNGANSGLSATVTIAPAAAAALNNVAGLGTGEMTFGDAASTLTLNAGASGTLANALVSATAGAGRFIKQDANDLHLFQPSSAFSGTINQQAGRILAHNAEAAGSADVNLNAAAVFEYMNVDGISDTRFHGAGAVAVTSSTLALNRANTNASYNLSGARVIANNADALGGSSAVIRADASSRIDVCVPQMRLGHLTVAPGAVMAFAEPAAGAWTSKAATIAGLAGTGGTFILNIDFSIPNGKTAAGVAGDYITLTGSNTGAHNVRIAYGDTEPSGYGAYVNTIEVIKANSQGDATFRLDTASGSIDRGINAYELRKGDGTDLLPDQNIWYLTDTGLGLAADAVIDTASLVGADWFTSLATVSQRMGEIRTVIDANRAKPRGNFWFTGHGYQLDADNALTGRSFKQNACGFAVGADKAMYSENSAWLLGAMADVTTINREFTADGKGTTNDIALGVYGAWMHDNGAYATLTLRADRYNNSFDSSTINRQDMHGKYNNQSFGASAEFGWRVARTGGWWIEPAVSVSWLGVDAVNYDTTPSYSKVQVNVGSVSAVQLGGQIRAGRSFAGGKWHPYVRLAFAQVSSSGGEIRAQDKLLRPDYDGARIEAGVGASYYINPANQIYFNYDYAAAGEYTRPVSINVGFRHAW